MEESNQKILCKDTVVHIVVGNVGDLDVKKDLVVQKTVVLKTQPHLVKNLSPPLALGQDLINVEEDENCLIFPVKNNVKLIKL